MECFHKNSRRNHSAGDGALMENSAGGGGGPGNRNRAGYTMGLQNERNPDSPAAQEPEEEPGTGRGWAPGGERGLLRI